MCLDVVALVDEVKFLVLLAKVRFETGNWEMAVQTLQQAKEQQSRIIKRTPAEVPDMAEQKKSAAE